MNMEIKNILTLVENEKLENYYPIFLIKDLVIEEKDGYYWLMHSEKYPMKINNTAKEIIELMTGKMSVYEIVYLITKKYNKNFSEIKKDVIKMLYKFEVIGYIIWKKRYDLFSKIYEYEDRERHISYKYLQEIEAIEKIKETIREAQVIGNIKKDVKFMASNIRILVNEHYENFFIMYKDEELIAMISLIPYLISRPITTYLFYYIGYFYIKNKHLLSKEELDDFVKYCIKWHIEYSGVFYEGEEIEVVGITTDQEKSHYTQKGFVEVKKLERECGEDSLIVFRKTVPLV